MAGYTIASLQEIRDNATTQLLEISKNFKPDYNINGQTVSWSQYRQQLQEQIAWANQEIINLGGPSEQETIAV